MQIVSWGDDLHEMTTPIFWGNKKSISKSAEIFSQGAERLFFLLLLLYVIHLKAPFSSKIDIFYPRKVYINCFMVVI